MSDDLVSVQMSQPMCIMGTKDIKHLCDRIEELKAKLATCEKYRDAYAECDRIGAQAVRDLEAKLAKAVEMLNEADQDYNRKTNDLIARHADRIEELAKERDRYLRHLTAGAESLNTYKARIEELEAENARLGQQCEGLMQAGMNNGQALILAEAERDALAEKLEKAVEALDGMCLEFRQADLPYGSKAYTKATATLAELKG